METKKQRSALTICFAVLSVGIAWLSYIDRNGPAGAFEACAFLILAWRLAFVGAPVLTVSIRDIYRTQREGSFNWPLAGKLCDLSMGILLLTSAAISWFSR